MSGLFCYVMKHLENECMDFQLDCAKQAITVEILVPCVGNWHMKAYANANKIDRAGAEERKRKGLPTEYYRETLYSPERAAFFIIPFNEIGLGSGSVILEI